MAKDKDIEVLSFIVRHYCKAKHQSKKGKLCPACQKVLDYAIARRLACPHGECKPFCAYCEIKCYKPSVQVEIRKMMRYGAWRMLFYKPFLVASHALEGRRYRKNP